MIKILSGRGIQTAKDKDLYITVESRGGKNKTFKTKNAKHANPVWNEEDIFDFDNFDSAYFEIKAWADTSLFGKDTVVGTLTLPLKPYAIQGFNAPVEYKPLVGGPGELQIQILITTAAEAEKKGWSTGQKVAAGVAGVAGVAAAVGLGAFAVHEYKEHHHHEGQGGFAGAAPGGSGGHGPRNPGHGEVFIFEHKDFGGKHHKFTQQCEDLRKIGMNDMLSSITVGPNTRVTVYENCHFGGKSLNIDRSTPWIGDQWNDKVSSLKVHHH